MEGTQYPFLGITDSYSYVAVWCVFSRPCVNQVPTIHRILASLVEVGNLLAFEILEPIKVELAVLPAKTTTEKMKKTTSKKRRHFLRRALTRVTPEGTIHKWRSQNFRIFEHSLPPRPHLVQCNPLNGSPVGPINVQYWTNKPIESSPGGEPISGLPCNDLQYRIHATSLTSSFVWLPPSQCGRHL